MKKHGLYYLYIVQCKNGTYYTGITKNLDNRIKLHNSGRGAKYLRGKSPVKLVYVKKYKYYRSVMHAEIELKKISRRQKEKLVYGHKTEI